MSTHLHYQQLIGIVKLDRKCVRARRNAFALNDTSNFLTLDIIIHDNGGVRIPKREKLIIQWRKSIPASKVTQFVCFLQRALMEKRRIPAAC